MNNSGRSGGGFIGILVGLVVIVGGFVAAFKLLPALFKVLIWIAVGVAAIIIAVIIIAIVFARRSDKYKDERTAVGGKSENLSDEQNDVLKEARKDVMDLRRVIMQINNLKVRTSANEVCGTADKIIQTLKEKPEKLTEARQCLKYYIPTLKDVLTHFEGLEDRGQLSDDMKDKTLKFLGDVKSALQKQYDNLFEADKLDMEVDMEAMTIAIKRDGLL